MTEKDDTKVTVVEFDDKMEVPSEGNSFVWGVATGMVAVAAIYYGSKKVTEFVVNHSKTVQKYIDKKSEPKS